MTKFPNVSSPQSEDPGETLNDSHPAQAAGVNGHLFFPRTQVDSPSFATVVLPDPKAKESGEREGFMCCINSQASSC